MLGKLLKYDFKYLNKMLLVIHGFLILFSLAARFILLPIFGTDNDPNGLILSMMILMYCFIVISAAFATYIVIAVRFYKNLFSNEGYVSRTIPVKSSAHLISKTISGAIWSLIDSVLILLTVLLIFTLPIFSDNSDLSELFELMGISGGLMALFAITLIISCISNVVTIYISIALGQTFTNHKVMASIAMYFAVSTVAGVISTCVAIPFTIKAAISADTSIYSETFTPLLFWMTIISLVLTVVMYIITNYIMKKKVNL